MIALIGLIVLTSIIVWFLFKPGQSTVKKWRELEPGTKLTNRKGKHYTIGRNGSMSADVNALLSDPKVQKQIDGFQKIFMRQTILALWQGKRPPHSVGGYGTLTKKKLIIEWNDKWQAEMDKLSESYDLDYDILFDIPKEHPEAGIVYTADEIVKQYGGEKESS